MTPDTLKLIERIEALEAALKPFACAAEGFSSDFDTPLEYLETDERYYDVYSDTENLTPLTIADLKNASTVLHWDY